MRVTRKAIGAALAASGLQGYEVYPGVDRSYWYFVGPTTGQWYSTMVYVTRLSDLTVEEWVARAWALIEETREYRVFIDDLPKAEV